MKTDALTEADKIEIAKTARLVVQEPDTEDFWTQVADYFDSSRQDADQVIEPRPTSSAK